MTAKFTVGFVDGRKREFSKSGTREKLAKLNRRLCHRVMKHSTINHVKFEWVEGQ